MNAQQRNPAARNHFQVLPLSYLARRCWIVTKLQGGIDGNLALSKSGLIRAVFWCEYLLYVTMQSRWWKSVPITGQRVHHSPSRYLMNWQPCGGAITRTARMWPRNNGNDCTLHINAQQTRCLPVCYFWLTAYQQV